MTDALWQLGGWTMVHFLWLGTAVALLGATLRFACRRAAPNLRYAVSLATLTALAALPLAIAAWLTTTADLAALSKPPALPGDSLAFERELISPPSQSPAPQHAAPQVIDLAVTPIEAAQGRESFATSNSQPISNHPVAKDSRPFPASTQVSPPPQASFTTTLRTLIPNLPYLWLLGAPLTFTLLASGLIGSERLRRHSTPLTSGPAAAACDQLRHAVRITRHVSIAVCDSLAQPILLGIVRPLILLPASALSGWTPEELEMVLLHELAHVRRWDNLVNLLQRIVESALFFHPAVWLASRQVRRDREECCDAVVVAHINRPHDYAALLVTIAATRSRLSVVPALAAASAMADHPLTGRIRRILKLEEEPMAISRRTLALTLAAPLLFVAATIYSGAAAQDPPPSQGAEQPSTVASGDRAQGGSTREAIRGGIEDADPIAKLQELQADLSSSAKQADVQKKVLKSLIESMEKSLAEVEVHYKLSKQSGHPMASTIERAIASAIDNDAYLAESNKALADLHQQIQKRQMQTRSPNDPELKALYGKAKDIDQQRNVYLSNINKSVRNQVMEILTKDELHPEDVEYQRRRESLTKSLERYRARLASLDGTKADASQGSDADELTTIATYTIRPAAIKEMQPYVEDNFKQLELDSYQWSGDYRWIRIKADKHHQDRFRELIKQKGWLERIEPSELTIKADSSLNDGLRVPLSAEASQLATKIARIEDLIAKTQQDLINIEIFKRLAVDKARSPLLLERAVAESVDKDPQVIALRQKLHLLQEAIQGRSEDSKKLDDSQRRKLAEQAQQVAEQLAQNIKDYEEAARNQIAKMPNEAYRAAIVEHKIRHQAATENLKKYTQELDDAKQRLAELNANSQEPHAAFPPLEDQKLADRAYCMLGVDLEPINADELARVKKLGYQGGLRIAGTNESLAKFTGLRDGDVLVGLHAWPAPDFKALDAILSRKDLIELTPLKYRIVRRRPDDFDVSRDGMPEFVTGRIDVNREAITPHDIAAADTQHAQLEAAGKDVSTAPATASTRSKPQWHKDVEAAERAVAKNGKFILLYFYSNGSAACKSFNKNVFESPKTRAAIDRDYEFVKVDVNAAPHLASHYDVTSIPAAVMISREAEPYPVLCSNRDDFLTQLSQLREMFARPAAADDKPKANPSGDRPLQPGDQIMIQVVGAFPEHPIHGSFSLEPTGAVALGPTYGRVEVAGKTVVEAEAAITRHLATILSDAAVQVTLWAPAKAPPTDRPLQPSDSVMIQVIGALPEQPIDNVYEIESAGTVALGPAYGRVHIAGQSILEAQAGVEKHLKTVLTDPKVQLTMWGQADAPNEKSRGVDAAKEAPLYLYDGKPFDEWRNLWQHELKTERRIEAIKALAAFARAGHGQEAVAAIFDVADQYGIAAGLSKTEQELVKAVVDVVSMLPANVWMPLALDRLATVDPAHRQRWQAYVSSMLSESRSRPEDRDLALQFVKHADPSLLTRIALYVYAGDQQLEDPRTVEILRQAIKSEPENMAILSRLNFTDLDKVPEQISLLLLPQSAENARSYIHHSAPQNRKLAATLAPALLAILDDPERKDEHVAAIRALRALSPALRHRTQAVLRGDVVLRLAKLLQVSDGDLTIPTYVAIDHLTNEGILKLLDMQVDKGVITRERFDELKKIDQQALIDEANTR